MWGGHLSLLFVLLCPGAVGGHSSCFLCRMQWQGAILEAEKLGPSPNLNCAGALVLKCQPTELWDVIVWCPISGVLSQDHELIDISLPVNCYSSLSPKPFPSTDEWLVLISVFHFLLNESPLSDTGALRDVGPIFISIHMVHGSLWSTSCFSGWTAEVVSKGYLSSCISNTTILIFCPCSLEGNLSLPKS